MTRSSVARCDWCGDTVEWAITPKRRRMPLDRTRYADDDARANVAVRRDPLGGVHARVLTVGEPLREGEHRTTAHFTTCEPYMAARKRRQRPQPIEGAPPVDEQTELKLG